MLHSNVLIYLLIGCRALAYLSCMASVVEHAIECHFKAVAKPDSPNLELPSDVSLYGWRGVTMAFAMPEASLEEFCQTAISNCAALTLHVHLLQLLPRCTSLEQEFAIAVRVVQWCTQMKPK